MSLFIYAILGLIAAFISTGYFHGVHHDVEWKIGTFEGFNGVAQVHIGHYKDIMPVIDAVKKSAVLNNVVSIDEAKVVAGFGLYYDDPHKVTDSSKWRSRGGIILPKTSLSKALDTEEYKVLAIPPQQALITEFPYVSTLSIFVGLFKVYPAHAAYEKKHNVEFGSIIEIHDYANKKIRYIALEQSSPSGAF